MFLMFVIIMSIVILFFVANICYEVYMYSKKELVIKGDILEIINCVSMVLYMVMAIMSAVGLNLIGDYVDKELAFTGIVVGILMIVYVLNFAYNLHKNRKFVLMKSYSINLDYNIIANHYISKAMNIENIEECERLTNPPNLMMFGMNIVKKDLYAKRECFDRLKMEFSDIEFKALSNKDILKRLAVKFVPLLIAIAILVVGIVRFS